RCAASRPASSTPRRRASRRPSPSLSNVCPNTPGRDRLGRMSLEAPGGILRRVIRLSLPVVALNILGVLTLFVDTLFVSRLEESESALIALSFAGQIVFLAQVPMLGLSIGSAVMVSRAFGGGERRRVAELSRQSLQMTLLAGALMALFGPPLLPSLLHTLG